MELSNKGRDLLINREGRRNRAYLDSKSIPTIGVGHTGPEVYLGLVWTDQQIDDAFTDDVKWAVDAVNKHVKVPLNQNQFDALVSFVFNIGETQFMRSTLVRRLNMKEYELAAKEFDRWVFPKEITGRRMQEKAQFLEAV